MEKYLDDVDYFIANFDVTSGGKGETFFNWMRGRTNNGTASVTDINSISTQLDELHQTIRDFRANKYTDTNTRGLGQDFEVGKPGKPKKQYDRRSIDDDYCEYKNVDFASKPLINQEQTIDQFINGYLRNIESFDKLKWKAGFDKLKKTWDTPEKALTEMKKQWKKVFETYTDNAFNSIWSNELLRHNIFGALAENQSAAKTLFNNFVKTTDDRLFKFIVVE